MSLSLHPFFVIHRILNQRILELTAQLEDLQETQEKAVQSQDSSSAELRARLTEQIGRAKHLEVQLQNKVQVLEETETRATAANDKVHALQLALERKDEEMKAVEDRYKKYLEKAKNVSTKSGRGTDVGLGLLCTVESNEKVKMSRSVQTEALNTSRSGYGCEGLLLIESGAQISVKTVSCLVQTDVSSSSYVGEGSPSKEKVVQDRSGERAKITTVSCLVQTDAVCVTEVDKYVSVGPEGMGLSREGVIAGTRGTNSVYWRRNEVSCKDCATDPVKELNCVKCQHKGRVEQCRNEETKGAVCKEGVFDGGGDWGVRQPKVEVMRLVQSADIFMESVNGSQAVGNKLEDPLVSRSLNAPQVVGDSDVPDSGAPVLSSEQDDVLMPKVPGATPKVSGVLDTAGDRAWSEDVAPGSSTGQHLKAQVMDDWYRPSSERSSPMRTQSNSSLTCEDMQKLEELGVELEQARIALTQKEQEVVSLERQFSHHEELRIMGLKQAQREHLQAQEKVHRHKVRELEAKLKKKDEERQELICEFERYVTRLQRSARTSSGTGMLFEMLLRR